MTTQKKSLQIEGMIGPACEKRIEEILQKLPGVVNISAHTPIHAVFIEYEPKILSWDQLKYEISLLGYQCVDTTETLTFNIPEALRSTVRETFRQFVSQHQWVENVQFTPMDTSFSVSFDSRAWTAHEIKHLVYENLHQESLVD